jgi:hypothetical protein
MKKELTLIEIKDDAPIKEWAILLMSSRNEEARDSLVFEGVEQENCFYVEIDEKKYIAFYMEGERLDPGDPSVKINKDHKAVKDAMGRIRRIDGELLYSLSAPKN